MKRLLVVVLAALWGADCKTHTQVAPEDRAVLEQTLTGPEADRFLRVSLYITPFFGDASKRLLTPYPPEDVLLLAEAAGAGLLAAVPLVAAVEEDSEPVLAASFLVEP